MPFLYIVILAMIVVYVWPQIVLWLPRAIYGN
jgi:TRAP-type mannitol/chloroaromatic compound transport system permease large subunit